MNRWLSPLRYPGGKARMAPYLSDLFWTCDVELWIEPFGGGAGAALAAVIENDVPEAWIIESNPALAAFWTTIMSDGGRLAARVEGTAPSLGLFWSSRETVTAALAGQTPDREELAYAAFILNRCSRSGMILGNVGPIGGKAQSSYTVASRFPAAALAERIRAVAALGQRFRVFEDDGIEYVAALADSGFGDEVFVFADPPYIGAGERLYAHALGDGHRGAMMARSARHSPQARVRNDGHSRLAEALLGCPAPWALTYDAADAVIDLYPGCRVLEFEIPHSAGRGRIGTEYLVTPPGLELPSGNPLGRGAIRTAA